MLKRISGIFLILLLCIPGYSQKFHFQHITSSDGLSQSEVYSFLEDSRGFMWFGTLHGLNRYDGYNITTFHTDRSNPNSLTSNTVRSLEEDHLGRVWIGTNRGLNVYDPRTEKIHQIDLPEFQDKKLTVYSIIFDKHSLLISTTSGIFKTNINTKDLSGIGKEFKRIHYSENYNTSISLIEKSNNGMIWVSNGTDLFSMIFIDQNEEPIIVDHISDDRLGGARAMTFDEYNNLWISTFNEGFFRYRTDKKILDQFRKNLPNKTITTSNTSAVSSDGDGNIWVGTRDKGLLFLPKGQLNDESPKFKSIQSDPFDDRSLSSNLIYSLYFSKNRNLLWIGTVGSGINIYEPQQKQFSYYRIPPKMDAPQSVSNFVRSVYIDYKNDIWVGTHNDGLYLFDREKSRFYKAGFGTESIYYIGEIDKNELIICTSAGVSLARIVEGHQLKITKTSINNGSFYAIKIDEDNLWIATGIGLYRCSYKNKNFRIEKLFNTNSNPAISFNNCRVLHYSSTYNELYVGTEGGGLNILEIGDNNEIENVTVYQKEQSPNSLSNNFIRTIIEDSNKNLWLGTYEGLNKAIRNKSRDSLTFKTFTTKDGLPNNMVQLLVEDDEGSLWIGTNKGLCKFNPQSEEIVRYTKSDGIQGNEFSEHAVHKRPDGEIIVGGTNGFNTFYPECIKLSKSQPKTTITNFYLSNEPIDIVTDTTKNSTLTKSITLTDSLFLKPNQNNIGFEFSALIYSNPEKVQYSYKLEGFDEDWNYTSANNRRANYTNLEYGDYVFKVRSTNNDGLWEEESENMYIHINTPFYLTWPAYLLYALFIILLLVYFTNYTVIKYTTKKKILLENEHNQQLHALDEMRTRFFINISHDLRTPLTLISSPLSLVLKDEDLNKKTRNRLELIRRNVKKLRYITEQLLDIRKAEAGKLVYKPENGDLISFIKIETSHFTDAIKSKGLRINIISGQDTLRCQFDPDMISKIFFNLLSNAIKYTHEGDISVFINVIPDQGHEVLPNSKSDSCIRMEIQDSGKGISPDQLDKIFERFYQGDNKDFKGYGIGLSHCKDLVEAHEGSIEVTSSEDSGTKFSVTIPYIKPVSEEPESKHFLESTPDIHIKSAHTHDTPEEVTEDGHRNKILLVDDNSDMRSFIKEELIKQFTIIEANDGVDGLKKAEKQAPDLIISDIMMPNMDGIEFCEKLKSDVKTSHIPVILLTAKGDTQTKYKGIETGADDYIQKPFDIEYLELRIKNIINNREIIRVAFQSKVDFSPSSVELVSHDKKFLLELIAAIEEGIPDPDFNVNTLESKMGMSHTNFYRKVKSLTGESGKEILMDMRMKRAKQILSDNSNIRISDVAYSVGFSDPKYFSKCFKEHYGVLPSHLSGRRIG